jgi:hypothetical protein
MTQGTLQATRPKRKWFQFRLRTLFVLISFCCLAAFAMKWHHEASLAKRKQWLLNRGGNAVLLEDGDVVLVRDNKSCGAFVVKSQNMQPERMEYDWYYRSDGNGMVFANDPAVSSGSGSSGTPWSQINIHFGSFALRWSGRGRGFGWFYYPGDRRVEFCVIRKPPQLRSIDAKSEWWQFKSAKDKPPVAPPSRNSRIKTPNNNAVNRSGEVRRI